MIMKNMDRKSIVINTYKNTVNVYNNTLQCPILKEYNILYFTKSDVFQDFREVLVSYNEAVSGTVLSGPTSFAPIIRRAVRYRRVKPCRHL